MKSVDPNSSKQQAARTQPIVEMNPILMKPKEHLQAEVLLMGVPLETIDGETFREEWFDKGLEIIQQALNYLSDHYDTLIIEGAGSTAEVNLMDRELTNMRVAELADVPVILVADISKGGAFASVIGTLQLLSEERRQRVKGILINKFYGDASYFEDGGEIY